MTAELEAQEGWIPLQDQLAHLSTNSSHRMVPTEKHASLVEVETGGQFDPHVHEALVSQPSEQEDGSVIEVLQKGYRLGDRVLRPARVVVSQGE